MASKFKRHEEAEAFEYAVMIYLRACGYRTFGESLNYNKTGAPLVRGEGRKETYASADIAAMKDGYVAFFEVKWKSATFTGKFNKQRLTGIDLEPYRSYQKHEADSGASLVIVFCHQRENEVRCATLAELSQIESHRCTQQQYPESKGGMINWYYDRIPVWMKYTELEKLAADFKQTGQAVPPTGVPIQLPQPETQVPMFDVRWRGQSKPTNQNAMVRGSHAIARHVDNTPPAPRSLASPIIPQPCEHCGALPGDADCLFSVTRSDLPDFVMCGTCWHAGITPDQSQRMRSAGWRP